MFNVSWGEMVENAPDDEVCVCVFPFWSESLARLMRNPLSFGSRWRAGAPLAMPGAPSGGSGDVPETYNRGKESCIEWWLKS